MKLHQPSIVLINIRIRTICIFNTINTIISICQCITLVYASAFCIVKVGYLFLPFEHSACQHQVITRTVPRSNWLHPFSIIITFYFVARIHLYSFSNFNLYISGRESIQFGRLSAVNSNFR